jgi:Transglycosylase associated protein.
MIGSIIIGILAGYIASKIQKGEGSGCLINLFLGVIGGVIGNFLFSLAGFSINSIVGELISSIVGAVLILWIFSRLR